MLARPFCTACGISGQRRRLERCGEVVAGVVIVLCVLCVCFLRWSWVFWGCSICCRSSFFSGRRKRLTSCRPFVLCSSCFGSCTLCCFPAKEKNHYVITKNGRRSTLVVPSVNDVLQPKYLEMAGTTGRKKGIDVS